jgi:hypothetical protein
MGFIIIFRLQRQLQIVKESISHWERRVSENQRSSVTNVTKDSSTSPGLPLIQANSDQLGNRQIIAPNNKVPRVSQFIRPTPKIPTKNTGLFSCK